MSNFLLPKNNIINTKFKFEISDNINSMNTSVVKYFTAYLYEIQQLVGVSNYNNIINLLNPYIYIVSNIPGSKHSVSKLKAESLLFYEFIEINSLLDLFVLYKNKTMNILNIGVYKDDFEYYVNMMIEGNVIFDSYLNIEMGILENVNKKYDFIYLDINAEIDSNQYINNMIKSLAIILNCQSNEGTCVIKIDNIFYKPIVELLYLLSSFFEKVCVIKPLTTNMITSDKFIVCKNFLTTKLIKINNGSSLTIDMTVFDNLQNKVFTTILNNEVPCYFLNKIHDLNSIIVQHQLETMETLINILRSKDKDEKFELLKKNNILKSILWCEKFKIPYNKFVEKTNIFLPIKNEEETSVES